MAVTYSPGTPLGRLAPGERIPLLNGGKRDLSTFRRYLDLYRSRSFDIVHVQYSPDLFVAACAAKVARAGPVVFTRHVAEPWGPLKRPIYLRWIDHLIPSSLAVEAVLLRSGVPADRMSMAKAGCPALVPSRPRDEVRKEWGFEGFTVGVFGRLVREKGLDVAIEAAARTDIALELFGDGPLLPELEAQAKDLKAPVRFWGFQEQIADAMNAVDAVAIPSRWAEAFPFAALEAMSMGKPIVAAATGGLPEMVEDNRTGLLFRPEDASDMASKLELLSRSPDLVSKLGAKALEQHRELYTIDKMAERMERVYGEIV